MVFDKSFMKTTRQRSAGRAFLAEGSTGTKTIRREPTSQFLRMERSLWLECSVKGGVMAQIISQRALRTKGRRLDTNCNGKPLEE